MFCYYLGANGPIGLCRDMNSQLLWTNSWLIEENFITCNTWLPKTGLTAATNSRYSYYQHTYICWDAKCYQGWHPSLWRNLPAYASLRPTTISMMAFADTIGSPAFPWALTASSESPLSIDRTRPGQKAKTRIFRSLSRLCIWIVIIFKAALLIRYSSHHSVLFTFCRSDASCSDPNALDIWMRRGWRDRTRRGMKVSEASIAPRTFVEKIFSILSRPAEPGDVVPALLIRTSSRPNRSETMLKAFEIEVSSSTSSWITESVPWMLSLSRREHAACPFERSRQAMITWYSGWNAMVRAVA